MLPQQLDGVEDFEREVYGRIPRNVPRVTWTVTESDTGTIGGKRVVAKQLVGHVDNSAYPIIDVNIAMTLVRLGMQRFSLSAAAEQAAVSRSTLYNWFGDKQTAIEAAFDFLAEQFISLFAVAVRTEDTLAGQVGQAAAAVSTVSAAATLAVAGVTAPHICPERGPHAAPRPPLPRVRQVSAVHERVDVAPRRPAVRAPVGGPAGFRPAGSGSVHAPRRVGIVLPLPRLPLLPAAPASLVLVIPSPPLPALPPRPAGSAPSTPRSR